MASATQIADDLLNAWLDADPLIATLLGIRDREDLLADYSEAAEDAFATKVRDIAARAEQLDAAGLSRADAVTRAVVLRQAEVILDLLAARAAEYTIIDNFTAPAISLFIMLPMIGIAEQPHADGYLARLAALPSALRTLAQRHRAGIAAGRLPVRHLTKSAIDFLDRYLTDPDADPLRRPRPAEDAPVDRAAFDAERDRLLAEVVRPAVARYREALVTEVLPHGRPADRGGLSWLPGGADIYSRLIRAHTTTDRTPEELHRIGLSVMERLAEEYVEIGSRALGTDSLPAVLARLGEDPALRWRDGDELLAAAQNAVGRAEQAAPRWFGRLPSQRCGVEAVPAGEAPGAPGAYYVPPALDGSRSGTYFANTYRASERHRYDSEAVAFHEAVPGHHFQMALAMELAELPMLRRLADFTAYGEGWGLYCERLADEMGLYSDDVSRLGMVTADSMRAARLVVDTGLHAMGWSRQQAIDYMRTNTAMSTVEIESEVDRYLAAPGQALAYMVGRLEIQRIRAEAEQRLGDRFDIKSFHDTVLGCGPVPLDVLEEIVQAWSDGR
jgi:uncharacterized protein (DUF885 family)